MGLTTHLVNPNTWNSFCGKFEDGDKMTAFMIACNCSTCIELGAVREKILARKEANKRWTKRRNY